MLPLLSLSTALLLADAALPLPSSEESPPTGVHYKPITILDIEDEAEVTATLQRPEGVSVVERRSAAFPSLIVLRADFMPEMNASVDEIR